MRLAPRPPTVAVTFGAASPTTYFKPVTAIAEPSAWDTVQRPAAGFLMPTWVVSTVGSANATTLDPAVSAVAGGTLVFDQYGRVKYHIAHHLSDRARQARRIAYLWQQGQIDRQPGAQERFASLHRARALSGA